MDVINKIGRRKTAVARIYVTRGSGEVVINSKTVAEYFPTLQLQYKVNQPFTTTNTAGQFDVRVNVDGGGITGQAEAIRLAISRALVEVDETYKSALKVNGFLTRDPRMVERKKFGRRKARRRFQFSKR